MATSKQPDIEAQASSSAPKVDEVAVCQHLEMRAVPKFHTDTPETEPTGICRSMSSAEKRLVRKLDWIILPVLWVMYWFNYLDRNAITVARLDGIEMELNLTSTEYQTCVSILFVGYILGQIPSNMLITRIRPSWFMASTMALWSIVSTVTGVTKDFKGLLLTRFFLGITEAPFYPGALYLLGIFYTRKEIATRISILFTANICGTAFSSLIAIGVFQMKQVAGLSGWRWLFILQGVISFIVAVSSAFLLPDQPLDTRWLSEEERKLAQSRVAADTVQLQASTSTWAGLYDASRDPRLWVLVAMQHLHLSASGYKNFFPTIVETLGFGRNVTLALTCPPYIISGIATIAWAASSGEVTEQSYVRTTDEFCQVTSTKESGTLPLPKLSRFLASS
ncbi:hypothetical protein CaCOL14_001617 [Colletotrichum acutatum]